MHRLASCLGLLPLAASLPAMAGSAAAPAAPAAPPPAPTSFLESPWFTGRSVSFGAPLTNPLLGGPQQGGLGLGGIFFPHLHVNQAYGGSSADHLSDLITGAHDPNADGWTLQGIEAEASFRFNEYVEGFTGHHIYWDQLGGWDYEHDESFIKFKNLPGGFELRGGQYFNRFGFHNAMHLHGMDFIDNFLVSGRFLGDHNLTTLGGEVTWNLPVPWQSALSVSVGKAREDDHDHAHGGHGSHGADAEFEAEGALFNDVVVTANWTNLHQINDFHRLRFGLSGAFGDNAFGRSTQVYGSHFEYEWRQNGLEPGGNYFRWRTEAMIRSFGAISGHLPGEAHDDHDDDGHDEHEDEHAHHDEHEDDHQDEHGHEEHEDDHHDEHDDHDADHEEQRRRRNFSEFGIYTYALYGMQTGFAGPLEIGLRGDYVTGISDAGLDERFRLSPSARLFLNKAATVAVGVQYNWDRLANSRDEHSVWTQLSFDWGGPEVR